MRDVEEEPLHLTKDKAYHRFGIQILDSNLNKLISRPRSPASHRYNVVFETIGIAGQGFLDKATTVWEQGEDKRWTQHKTGRHLDDCYYLYQDLKFLKSGEMTCVCMVFDEERLVISREIEAVVDTKKVCKMLGAFEWTKAIRLGEFLPPFSLTFLDDNDKKTSPGYDIQVDLVAHGWATLCEGFTSPCFAIGLEEDKDGNAVPETGIGFSAGQWIALPEKSDGSLFSTEEYVQIHQMFQVRVKYEQGDRKSKFPAVYKYVFTFSINCMCFTTPVPPSPMPKIDLRAYFRRYRYHAGVGGVRAGDKRRSLHGR